MYIIKNLLNILTLTIIRIWTFIRTIYDVNINRILCATFIFQLFYYKPVNPPFISYMSCNVK